MLATIRTRDSSLNIPLLCSFLLTSSKIYVACLICIYFDEARELKLNFWRLWLYLSSTQSSTLFKKKTIEQLLNLVFIFILSSLSYVMLVRVKMAAVVWSNVTETANVSVLKGILEHIVKTVRNNNNNLLFVLIVSMYIITYRQKLNLEYWLPGTTMGASGARQPVTSPPSMSSTPNLSRFLEGSWRIDSPEVEWCVNINLHSFLKRERRVLTVDESTRFARVDSIRLS